MIQQKIIFILLLFVGLATLFVFNCHVDLSIIMVLCWVECHTHIPKQIIRPIVSKFESTNCNWSNVLSWQQIAAMAMVKLIVTMAMHCNNTDVTHLWHCKQDKMLCKKQKFPCHKDAIHIKCIKWNAEHKHFWIAKTILSFMYKPFWESSFLVYKYTKCTEVYLTHTSGTVGYVTIASMYKVVNLIPTMQCLVFSVLMPNKILPGCHILLNNKSIGIFWSGFGSI